MTPKDEPDNKNAFVEFVKKLWIPVAGFIGAILLIYQLVQIWQGDTQTTTWIVALTGLIVWVVFLVWSIFTKQTKKGDYKTSWVWVYRNGRLISEYRNPAQFRQSMSVVALIITVIGLISGWAGWQHHQQLIEQENSKKVTVIVAQFDGPEEQYGLRNQILEELNASLGNDKNIKVIPVAETITIADGSDYARKLGKQYQADFVFWGWYRPTENPNITLHIENLSPAEFVVLSDSETYKPPASIFDLESFSIQQKIGKQTSELIMFLSGVLFYNAHDYETALARFNDALSNPEFASGMLDSSDEYIYIANTNLFLAKYQDAYDLYSKAIELDQKNVDAYVGRGIAYAILHKFNLVINGDFDKAIEIDPNSWAAYNNRAVIWFIFGQSVNFADPTLANNPNNTKELRHIFYLVAISDLNKAITIQSQESALYTNRGQVFDGLGNLGYGSGYYKGAVDDYTQAIQYNPQDADAYYYRSKAYQNLGLQREADADFAKYKELTNQK